GYIHDLQFVASFQMLLADLPDVQDCAGRLRRGAGDVEPQHVARIGARRGGAHRFAFARADDVGWHERSRPRRLYVESDEHALLVGQIAEYLLDRLGEATHQRRHGDDLVAGGELRRLCQVDDLDPILPGEVRLADTLEIGDGGHRFRSLAGDV